MVKDKKLKNTSKIDVHEKALPDLVIAALSNDLTAIQSLSVKIARSLSEKDPIVSSKIISIVSDFSISPQSFTRYRHPSSTNGYGNAVRDSQRIHTQ
jgi:hypothetical protein